MYNKEMERIFEVFDATETEDGKITLQELVKAFAPDVNNNGTIDDGSVPGTLDEMAIGRRSALHYLTMVAEIDKNVFHDGAVDRDEFKAAAKHLDGNFKSFQYDHAGKLKYTADGCIELTKIGEYNRKFVEEELQKAGLG
jgi:Ca2+-binding EF-hand superfamily protein